MLDAATVSMILGGIRDSFYMLIFSTVISYVIGLPLGVALIVTDKDGIHPLPLFNAILGFVINLLRSVPFLILLFLVMPFTQFVVGTSFGVKATIVPLIISAAPYIARLVESSFKEIDRGVIEAAQSMGASSWQIITKVILPESKPSLLVGSVIAATTILGYSAMAGVVGGGGLGDIAIRYGYYRYQEDLMYICVILLLIIVQIIQEVGMRIATKSDKRIS